MEKKRVRKATKHRLFILIPVIASFSYYTYKIYSLKSEKRELTEKLEKMKDEEDNLQTDIEKFKNPDYLARYARENYHYSKEGELVIQTKKKEEAEISKEKEEKTTSSAIFIFCVMALFLIATYLLVHKTKKR